jgi:hypothetical protein
MMRKASLSSYALGVFAIASSIASTILESSVLGPIESALATGTVNASVLTQLYQIMGSFLPLTLLALLVTLFLAIVFAYYNFAVGRAYDVGSLRIAVMAYVMVQLLVIPVLLVAYELIPVVAQILSNPGNVTAIAGQSFGLVILIGLAGLSSFVFLVVFIVAFLMGLNRMQKDTEISLFGTAMWLALIGIILSFLNGYIFTPLGVPVNVGDIIQQIAIVLFGFSLSKAAKEGRVPMSLRQRAAPS